MEKRLSDLVEWDSNTFDSIINRVREKVNIECVAICFKDNKAKIDKSVLLNVLHGLRPIDWFVGPED